MTQMYISGASTQQRLQIPAAEQDTRSTMFPFAVASEEREGLVLTREILRDPDALTEVAAAREAIARGDAVRGIAAVRALRPRR
jgi:hypothetical protein